MRVVPGGTSGPAARGVRLPPSRGEFLFSSVGSGLRIFSEGGDEVPSFGVLTMIRRDGMRISGCSDSGFSWIFYSGEWQHGASR